MNAQSRTLAFAVVLLLAGALSAGCVGVGTRVCAQGQPGCDFTDHVLTLSPSGTVCPTWNVRFAQYNPAGQPTDTYAIAPGNDQLVETLRNAAASDTPVHVWYAGEKYVFYSKCKADYPLAIYRAEDA